MTKELTRIICPFCGTDQELEFMYTNDDEHEEECCNCYQQFTYKITQFDWEAWDSMEDIREGDPSFGDSQRTPPPGYLEEYAIPSFKCVIDHWTKLRNWKSLSWMEKLDWLMLRLPLFIRRPYFEHTAYWECR